LKDVIIRGDGVAAYCCAYLLHKAGFQVSLERVDRPRLPAIMLSDHALALIRDIFERQDLFRDAPPVRKRMVAWGRDSKLHALDHSAVVVSEEFLLKNLSPGGREAELTPGWTIYASRPLPAETTEHRFGSRMATAVAVALKPGSEPGACWIESLESGWLFLIPNAPGSAWLLSVGSAPAVQLNRSRVVAEQIDQSSAAIGEFPAYPRIVSPLSAPGWLACGTAAMAFDPLCGDGTAHAIREAILASAVIRAVENEGSTSDFLSHYEARLTAGFRRHLDLCREFYSSGAAGPWWDAELESIERGIAWCDSRLSTHSAFRYQLRDFELYAIR
jgi:2-polyprenyl-6-methoxyphenol hydroxylase-like FAD-dependent oxidoreductase